MALSQKLKALDTLSLQSMASGLRAMRGGQKHLLKEIEEEISSREVSTGSPAPTNTKKTKGKRR